MTFISWLSLLSRTKFCTACCSVSESCCMSNFTVIFLRDWPSPQLTYPGWKGRSLDKFLLLWVFCSKSPRFSKVQQEMQIKRYSPPYWKRQWHPTPVILPGESQGWQSLVGCHLWVHTESTLCESQTQLKRLSSSSSSPPYFTVNKSNHVLLSWY